MVFAVEGPCDVKNVSVNVAVREWAEGYGYTPKLAVVKTLRFFRSRGFPCCNPATVDSRNVRAMLRDCRLAV